MKVFACALSVVAALAIAFISRLYHRLLWTEAYVLPFTFMTFYLAYCEEHKQVCLESFIFGGLILSHGAYSILMKLAALTPLEKGSWSMILSESVLQEVLKLSTLFILRRYPEPKQFLLSGISLGFGFTIMEAYSRYSTFENRQYVLPAFSVVDGYHAVFSGVAVYTFSKMMRWTGNKSISFCIAVFLASCFRTGASLLLA